MVNTKFVATQQKDGHEIISLLRERPGKLFKRASNETVPIAEWPKVAPEAGLAALALARSFDQEGEILEDEAGVVVPPQIVAQLDEADAFALGLPPATPLTLQLNSSGSLAEGSITVSSKWVRRGGMPVRADILGARMREGGRVSRIPEPVFSALLAAQDLQAATDPDERRAAFAKLRELLGDELGAGIQADGFLERIRIAYAANFSLNAKTDHGRFDFDPVLFSRHVSESAEGELVDENEASLLTPQDTLHFQRRFRSQEGGRRSYLLSDGTLLFLDPLLGKALDIVRFKQAGTSQEKREFLRSPQRVLREELKLDATGDDEAADRLFIETQQFSERVSGIEIWQKPVLPWIKPKPNSWLPESFGLRIGDPPHARHIALAPGDAEILVGNLETAIRAGDEAVTWRDETIPATSATLQATRGLADLERKIAEELGDQSPSKNEGEPVEIFFLQVGENFEQLDYARLPRPAVMPEPFEVPALPKGLKSEPKPHQRDAFAWLTEAWVRRLPGVLLADDMGLGKTFQALTFLLWLRSTSTNRKPVLIVAPTGLLKNWQAELAQHVEASLMGPIIEAFGTHLRSYRLEAGSDIRGGTSRLDSSEWEDAGIVLTTYETMRDYHMSFARIPFDAIVYDEIQKLKNPASQMTRAAKALNGRLQIAMTGTPVENRLQDLWSIADTVYPGFLKSSREFETSYPADNLERLEDLQRRLVVRDGELPPFMLRRMKDEILVGLPEKTARKYAVEMPPAQAQAYAPRLLDDIYHVFEQASYVLDCPKECEMGCSACVLAADLYKQQDRLDRRGALKSVRAFLETNAKLPEEDRAVADAKAVNDAANTILLRACSGDSVTVFLPDAFDLAELSSIKMRSFFSSAAARGVPVTLVLTRKSFDNLTEVERRFLRDTAVRNDFRLALGEAEGGNFGNHRIAELVSQDNAKGFFSRDENAAQPGERWGVGQTHAVVVGSLNSPTSFALIAADDLERQVAPGDKVEVMLGFSQCPVDLFGKRFGAKLKHHMETAGIWHPGQLVRISYSDRYLNAPLPMLLFLRTCGALADELKANETVEVDVIVQPLKKDRVPYRIFNDWDHEGDREDVAQFLGEKLGLDVALEVTDSAIHGRKLELEYANGSKAVVLLDQGFGYWRVVGNPPRHDFRASPAAQASDLHRLHTAVSGVGESYFAVTRKNV